MENSVSQISEPKTLILDEKGIKHLSETRQWSMFFAVLGFIFCGLIMLVPVILLVVNLASPAPFFGLVALIPLMFLVAIYFFPTFFLYRFSVLSKRAIRNTDHAAFVKSLMFLKIFFRFIGILTIIMLSIYLLLFAFGVLAGSIFGMFAL